MPALWFVSPESGLIGIAFDMWFSGRNWQVDVVGTFVAPHPLSPREFCTWYDNVDIEGCVTMGTTESIEMSLKGWCCEKLEGLVTNTWPLLGVTAAWHVTSSTVPESFPSWNAFSSKDGEPSLCPVTVKRPWLFLVTLITFMFSFSARALAWKLLFGEKEIL